VEVTGAGPQPFSYSEVWDLKDTNVFEFTVPYISPGLWAGINSGTGGLSMTVVDPLIANGEASTEIRCLVEVACEQDFEFAAPRPPAMIVLTPNPVASVDIVTQSGADDGGVIEPPPVVIPDPPIVEQSDFPVRNDKDPKPYTVGEAFTSVKQLLMMPTHTTWTWDTENQYTYLPLFHYIPNIDLGASIGTLNTSVPLTANRAGLASAAFAYWQGTTSYDVYLADYPGTIMRAGYVPGDAGFRSTNTVSIYSTDYMDGGLKMVTGKNNMHFQAPAYAYNARNSWRNTYNAGAAYRNFLPGQPCRLNDNTLSVPVLQLYQDFDTRRGRKVVLGICGGDDAKVGTYIGPPPIKLFSYSDPDVFGPFPGLGNFFKVL
jgi:hypothetical protein